MKNKFYLILIVLAAAIIPLVTNFDNKKKISKTLPEINLESIYSKTPIKSQFQDKFILQIFATWCAKCNEYNHELLKIKKTHKLAIPIFGIAIKDNLESIYQLYTHYASPFTDIANDTKGFILADLGIRMIPETLFIKDKFIIKRFVGGASEKDILEFISN